MKKAILSFIISFLAFTGYSQTTSGFTEKTIVYLSDSISLGRSPKRLEKCRITVTKEFKEVKLVKIEYLKKKNDWDIFGIIEKVNYSWNCDEYIAISQGVNWYLAFCIEGRTDELLAIGKSADYADCIIFHKIEIAPTIPFK